MNETSDNRNDKPTVVRENTGKPSPGRGKQRPRRRGGQQTQQAEPRSGDTVRAREPGRREGTEALQGAHTNNSRRRRSERRGTPSPVNQMNSKSRERDGSGSRDNRDNHDNRQAQRSREGRQKNLAIEALRNGEGSGASVTEDDIVRSGVASDHSGRSKNSRERNRERSRTFNREDGFFKADAEQLAKVETAEDIRKDIERIEKEISLEMAEIKNIALS